MCWPSSCCLSFMKSPFSSSAEKAVERLPLLPKDAPLCKEFWGTLEPEDKLQCTKEFLHEGSAKGRSFVLLFEPTDDRTEQIACILQPVEKENVYVELGDPTLDLATQKDSGNFPSRLFSDACLTLSWNGENLKATFFGNKQSTVYLKLSCVTRSSTTEKVCIVFEKKMQGYERCILGPVFNSKLL